MATNMATTDVGGVAKIPTSLFVYIIRSPEQVARTKNVETLRNMCSSVEGCSMAVVTSQEPKDLDVALIKDLVDISSPITVSHHQEYFERYLSKKSLHVNQLSNALKHLTALRMILENASHFPNAAHVILEDDVIYNDNAISMLQKTIKNAPADYDMIFLGLPITKSGSPDNILYEPLETLCKVFLCCDSYIVSPKAATAMVSAFLPVRFPTQIQLSYLMYTLGLRVYACSPNFFMDGSKAGVYMSSIEQNNELVWNPHWNHIRAVLSKTPLDKTMPEADWEDIQKTYSAASFKGHPDFMYLMARVKIRYGKYQEARESFETALTIYTTEKCVLGLDSYFMKDFIRLFSYLQEEDIMKEIYGEKQGS